MANEDSIKRHGKDLSGQCRFSQKMVKMKSGMQAFARESLY